MLARLVFSKVLVSPVRTYIQTSAVGAAATTYVVMWVVFACEHAVDAADNALTLLRWYT